MHQSVCLPPLSQLSPYNRWTYVLTVPFLTGVVSYLLARDAYWQNGWHFAGTTFLNGALLTGSFFAQNRVTRVVTQRYPRFAQSLTRVALVVAANSLLSVLCVSLIAGVYSRFRLVSTSFTVESLLKIYGINLLFIVLSAGIYETFYSLNRWQQVQINREKLKKENLKGQLQGLKSQVNPHFLFNSLNSLSSLIADEPQLAEQFIDQMARVYRYMLQTNGYSNMLPVSDHAINGECSDELTTLDAELSFIGSYYHLLKTRHGTGLTLSVQVANHYRQHRLPPLTLQLLVENAVKHNSILASRPLLIEIQTTESGYLRVRNNVQKRSVRSDLTRSGSSESGEAESTHVGLANIQTKYNLLAQTEPQIEAGSDYFTVTLPLLAQA